MEYSLNIALIEPEIPQNTGNIARTCAATGAKLHLVGPMGFTITAKQVKRAGLDYWDKLDITYYDSTEGRYGCEFTPPAGAKNFVVTTVGGGGDKTATGDEAQEANQVFENVGSNTYKVPFSGNYKMLIVGGGGGGGRPNMAQAGGKNPAGIPDAIAQAKTALENMLK